MADGAYVAHADEDNAHVIQPDNGDIDLSDETVDWRFLSTFSSLEQPGIPRRGDKDFEPDGTDHQDRILADSRRAMHDVLSLERIQNPKNHVKAIWHDGLKRSSIDKPRGPHFQTVGRQGSDGRIWLSPEETLWLLEKGAVDCWWESGLPMSLQGCYTACLGDASELSLERFQVYANLKRTGYTVMRAPTWDTGDVVSEAKLTSSSGNFKTWVVGLFASAFHFAFRSGHPHPFGPLVEPGLWRSYNSVYRCLSLVPYHDAISLGTDPVSSRKTDSEFRVAYHVWKPRSSFRKSSPGEPDFRIAVVNARETSVPKLSQVSALMESVPYDPPHVKMQNHSYARLKHGYRNVVLAVVDQGVASYLRLGDAGFGSEKMYTGFWKRDPGGKNIGRSSAGGGRGRGNGRGRGTGRSRQGQTRGGG